MTSISVPCPKTTLLARVGSIEQSSYQQQKQQIAFPRVSGPKPSLIFGSSLHDPPISGVLCSNKKQSAVGKVHAQLNKVVAEKSSNSAPVIETKPTIAPTEKKDKSAEGVSGQNAIPDALSISTFMTQVSDLVKLVDSRDIMELQMKQLDCEIIIRKKEALQPPQSAPITYMQPPMAHAMLPTPPPPAPAVAPAPVSSPAAGAAPALPAPGKPSGSSHPPLKCPMAGTFYRCPAPGEPPFVKVGDKVQKGQVICIIEAMKLMNEIEADQSGTVAEVLAEDGKSVSVDTPLFVIVP